MSVSMVAEDEVYDTPLDQIDVSHPKHFARDTIGGYFKRLREEDPVHYCADGHSGAYWSVTKFNDIVRVDTDHKTFSSESTLGGISLDGPSEREQATGARTDAPDLGLSMFIAMDPPKHDAQRKVVSPIVAPNNLAAMAPIIRERAAGILDSLPVGEDFDWVDKVSIELTTMTLATLFDFPWEERRKLTRWSDVVTSSPGNGVDSWDQWKEELIECGTYFKGLWDQRAGGKQGHDLISMLAASPATANMPFPEFLGNLLLLIVGGNDTTRNSITGGVLALNQNPAEYDKLMNDTGLIPNMVSEIIRWQTPLSHMRRTALRDAEIGGKKIREGEKVAMWYLSGNRDSDVIDRADEFLIDRKDARKHLSFGFGIHRCVGNRLAELQLQIIWEEIVKRFKKVEVTGEAQRTFSNLIHGFTSMPVRLHPH